MSKQNIPALIDEQWRLRLEHFENITTAEQSQWLKSFLIDNSSFAYHLKRAWGCSEFIAMSCSKNPVMLKQLVDSGDLYTTYKSHEIDSRLSKHLNGAITEHDLFRLLRQFRNREVVRIIWRDLNKEADLEETTADMTSLAEACLQQALDFLYRIACDAWGTPFNCNGDSQQMIILGMGKLGGWELNISSDIDLIFAYPENGETRGEKHSISNQEFFIRLSQSLIKALDSKNDDGFVFRVDMRLRPYGQSGSLALSFDAMEEYYQTQGRDWERYAMIKARVVAGDHLSGSKLMSMLRPFTYRKYIDFSTLESLRNMKTLINREVQRKDISNNIKLGIGGIREVEFVVQSFQIIHGGRDTRFRSQSLKVISGLIESECLLPDSDIHTLYEAYTFLRNIEHILQGSQDLQTHMLPDKMLEQLKVSYLMGFDDWNQFVCCLEKHRSAVEELFGSIIVNEPTSTESSDEENNFLQAQDIWQCAPDQDAILELGLLGYTKPEEALVFIKKLQQSRSVIFMTSEARTRLDILMPDLISGCAQLENSTETLGRALHLTKSVARRSAYLALLKENPKVLSTTLQLCSASPWIAEQLSSNPALLDELLDHRTLYSLPDKDELMDELRQRMLRVHSDDLETQMEVLRYFKLSHSLHVAICEVTEILPLIKVSDYLTSLAETILTHAVEIGWSQMIERYGHPSGDCKKESEFLIVGYGKLGSSELGHDSDLDLVFIYDANPNESTNGIQVIDNSTFFIKLGQKIIHILTARLTSGVLYDVDVRLRPSGNSGMLVSSLIAFEKYQLDAAWTWEHQALVKARPVAGSPTLTKKFDNIRSRLLCKKRAPRQLIDDVSRMRDKMREKTVYEKNRTKRWANKTKVLEKIAPDNAAFNIKHDIGGIIDIEFIVQFLVLSNAHNFSDLAFYSDNIRILECLKNNKVISPEDADNLTKIYINYRSELHRLQLQKLPLLSISLEHSTAREQVSDAWSRLLYGN
tara:strand:- start:1153 stop:4101 length:2949 start_codon:yes stop_codon:yes gene_type:complete